MSDEVLVQAKNVSKKYCRTLKRSLWYGVQDVVGELIGRDSCGLLRPGEFWPVKDVSFALKRGECLGLIGPNGAGKSTLLKMLSGLIKPDLGSIRVRGRVGALIELGAGFNPILTGRENIYVNGSVLGFRKKEIDRKLDEIIDFAEIEEFIDSPVQSYSSGMKVRLGFAIAAQMEPDVLFIDEVLAVGDAGFRAKCYNRIASIAERTAIVFVSHSMQHVSRLSRMVLVLNKGEKCFYGAVPSAINHYYDLFKGDDSGRFGSGEAKVTTLTINGQLQPSPLLFGQPLVFDLLIETFQRLEELVINLTFRNLGGDLVAECNNFVRKLSITLDSERKYIVSVKVPENLLNPGIYYVSTLIMSSDMNRHYDWLRNAAKVEITGGHPGSAGVQFLGEWDINRVKLDERG